MNPDLEISQEFIESEFIFAAVTFLVGGGLTYEQGPC